MKTDLAKLQKNRDYRAIVVLAVEHLRLRIPFFAGAIQSRESWEMIKRSIDRFYELVTDEQITWLNRIRFNRAPHAEAAHPKPGWVYFLKGEHGYCKIGRTSDLNRRIGELRIQLPFRVELFHSIATPNPIEIERHFHDLFASKRANGEWFRLTEEDFAEIVEHAEMLPLCCYAADALPGLAALNKFLIVAPFEPLGVDQGKLVVEFVPDYRTGEGATDEEVREMLADHNDEIVEILTGRRCDVCGSPIDRSAESPSGRSEVEP
jgi:hypothetical protein